MLFFILQYYYLTDVYKFITVAVFIVISILEGIRLYLGYLGNLAEKVIYFNKIDKLDAQMLGSKIFSWKYSLDSRTGKFLADIHSHTLSFRDVPSFR